MTLNLDETPDERALAELSCAMCSAAVIEQEEKEEYEALMNSPSMILQTLINKYILMDTTKAVKISKICTDLGNLVYIDNKIKEFSIEVRANNWVAFTILDLEDSVHEMSFQFSE